MDKPGCWTNRSYLTDFIDYPLSPKRIDISVFKQLYVEKGLSAAQIAETVGASKQMVLARLRRAGIHRTPGRGRSPDNYRYPEPPFGLKIRNGRLVPNAAELKVVRMIVDLGSRKNRSWVEIVAHLNQQGSRTRRGKLWNRVGVRRVYKRWNGKI